MGQKKITFKWFTIPQYKQEEEYLSSMHQNGWKFTKVTFPGFYHFEKCEPANVTYRLDYNQEGVANKAEYVQMFADCGWEYLFDFVGYSYFCKESDATQLNDEIFCDDESRLDMMKRVFRGRVIPLINIFLGIILPQSCINSFGHRGGSIIVQSVLSYLFLILGVIYIVFFANFTIQFYQYEKSIYPDKNIKAKYCSISAGLIVTLIAMVGIMIWSHKSVYNVVDKENGFIIEADNLNGEVVKEFELNSGDTIYVNHKSDGGRLYMSIGQEDKEPVFFGNTFDEFEKFSVEIQESGVYQIKCSGKRVKGKIDIFIK